MAVYKIIRDEYNPDRYRLKVEGAKLLFKNFSGREDKWGNTFLTVNLEIDDEEIYQFLAADGWRFGTRKRPDETYAEPFEEIMDGVIAYPHTKLRINYDSNRPPKIYRHTSRNKTGELLDEDTVKQLDYDYITYCEVYINPSKNKKGYVNILHATVEDDPFADHYIDEDEDDDEETIPFN